MYEKTRKHAFCSLTRGNFPSHPGNFGSILGILVPFWELLVPLFVRFGNLGSNKKYPFSKKRKMPHRRRTTHKQKVAARKNLIKARRKWKRMSHAARARAMPSRKHRRRR